MITTTKSIIKCSWEEEEKETLNKTLDTLIKLSDMVFDNGGGYVATDNEYITERSLDKCIAILSSLVDIDSVVPEIE